MDYNGSRGYVFSGFVIIADDRETLEKGALRNLTSFRALYADSGAKYEVAERRAAFAADGGYSVSRQTPLGAFVIEEMKPGSEFSECDPRAPGDADEIEILQRLNAGVPEDFASEWEAAQPLYDAPTKTPPPAPAAIDTDEA